MSTSIDTMSANRISARTIFYISSLLILPVLYVFFYVLKVSTNGYAIEHWLPKWDRLLLITAIILLERIYTYKYSVSQRAVLGRDIISNVVNLYVTGPATAMLVLPILVLGPEHILGRKLVFAAPGQLGPFWLQVVVILLSVSFFRYWMHRFQHSNAFPERWLRRLCSALGAARGPRSASDRQLAAVVDCARADQERDAGAGEKHHRQEVGAGDLDDEADDDRRCDAGNVAAQIHAAAEEADAVAGRQNRR